jgi:hypothetical protein
MPCSDVSKGRLIKKQGVAEIAVGPGVIVLAADGLAAFGCQCATFLPPRPLAVLPPWRLRKHSQRRDLRRLIQYCHARRRWQDWQSVPDTDTAVFSSTHQPGRSGKKRKRCSLSRPDGGRIAYNERVPVGLLSRGVRALRPPQLDASRASGL